MVDGPTVLVAKKNWALITMNKFTRFNTYDPHRAKNMVPSNWTLKSELLLESVLMENGGSLVTCLADSTSQIEIQAYV